MMKNPKPLKKFGQNYLTDNNILAKIIEEFDPQPGQNIIEIGPGSGALTEKLLKRTDWLTAVEIDTRVIESLALSYPMLKLVHSDFLGINLDDFYKGNEIRIIGNIPYNITSSILFKIIENNNIISDAVLMVQHEVAKRITAERGTKDYSILSVILQHFCDVKIAFKVSPNVFYPRPKVFSAVIHLYIKKGITNDEDKKFFINIVKAAFGNRRKTLKNSLSNSIFAAVDFTGSGVDLTLRAEQLEENDFLKLSAHAKKQIISKTN